MKSPRPVDRARPLLLPAIGLGRENLAVPRWISATAWATAATLCLGVSVGLLIPFAGWAVALGLVWSLEPASDEELPGVRGIPVTR